MPNAELLVKTLHHIDANRSDWSQGSWRRCFAAHAVLLAGGRFAALVLEPAEWGVKRRVRGVPVPVRAQRLLGLTDEQAERLFLPTHDLPRLHIIVSDLCEVAA